MGQQVFFQGLARWFERRAMRARLRRLGLEEPVVELRRRPGLDGAVTFCDGDGVEVATVGPSVDGRAVVVRMSKECPYGWRVTYHGTAALARREVERQVWYQVCLERATAAESERNRGRRAEVGEMLARELSERC